ncbi:MAG: polysaccharide biosynthesis protein [Acidobacteria bacterium]|nr:polysaccharide biosynthesis protein [Acidobacteriota bacterium]MBW4044656.1 polysaccharide biosynthesis protein [Acidobacteriota bacterium]
MNEGMTVIADNDFRAWGTLLRRNPIIVDHAHLRTILAGKSVLVTGAGGWIGSALTKALAAHDPAHLVLVDASEHALYEIDRAMRERDDAPPHTSVLGNICDRLTMADIFVRHVPQIVYHAAAYKHVPLMERNPFAAVQNNALGTYTLAQVAADCRTEQLIMISTDKAADPVSIMGASKRLAELVLMAAAAGHVKWKALRLGNVIGSHGSVVPLFAQQIARGGPVTVTHRHARRYFLTTQEAVECLLLAASGDFGTAILVPELGEPVLIEHIARHMLAQLSSSGAAPVPIVYTGLRTGDKMVEALLATHESITASSSFLRVVDSSAIPSDLLHRTLRELGSCCRNCDADELLRLMLRAIPEYQPSELLLHPHTTVLERVPTA